MWLVPQKIKENSFMPSNRTRLWNLLSVVRDTCDAYDTFLYKELWNK